MKTIIPVGQKILVDPLPTQEQKIGSVVIPGTANAELAEGIILDAGPQYKEIYKTGDKVLYLAKNGVGVIHRNKPAVALTGGTDSSQGDIWFIVEDEN